MQHSAFRAFWQCRAADEEEAPSKTALPAAALQCLGLVQHHVLPLDPLEVLDILDHQLVACDDDMERCILGIQGFLLRESAIRLVIRSTQSSCIVF